MDLLSIFSISARQFCPRLSHSSFIVKMFCIYVSLHKKNSSPVNVCLSLLLKEKCTVKDVIVMWIRLVDKVIKGLTSQGHFFRSKHCQNLSCWFLSESFFSSLPSDSNLLLPFLWVLISSSLCLWSFCLSIWSLLLRLHLLNITRTPRRCHEFQVSWKVFYLSTLLLEFLWCL